MRISQFDLDIDAAVTDTDGSESISRVIIRGLPSNARLSAGNDNGDGSWSLQPRELKGLKLLIEGLGNSDFELEVQVFTVDGQSETSVSQTLPVNLQHDTLRAMAAQQLIGQSSASPVIETDTRFRPPSDAAESPEFSNEIRTIVGDREVRRRGFPYIDSDAKLWKPYPANGPLEDREQENEQPSPDAAPDDLRHWKAVQVASTELPDPVTLIAERPECFKQQMLDQAPVAISDFPSIHEFGDTDNLCAASLLALFTVNEDSRKKLRKLPSQKRSAE